MLKTSDILDEKDKRIRAKNVDVTFPMSKEEKKLIYDMLEHLRLSQIELNVNVQAYHRKLTYNL